MQNEVRDYYNDHVEEEDRRLDNHPFEIPVLMHFVNRYLKKGDRLFDVACGAGRIAGRFGERFELCHGLNEKLKKRWMAFIIAHCEDPGMLHNAKHLLSIERKPD